jgi:8-oxo-dGTP pyrophosphatase MutT (NUDIX family)
VRSALEREVKLGAPPAFVLPDLSAVVDGITVRRAGDRVLDATYYDVLDLRLIREGVTVRHRTGDAEGQGTWTVKLPDAASGVDGGLARSELEVDGPPGAIPVEVAAAVAARVGTGSLQPVARLRTTRHRWLLEDADGVAVAEVDDDEVEVLDDDELVGSFREVEVELAGEAQVDVLTAVVSRLREAGAGEPDPTPKLARALRMRARQPDRVVRAAGGVVWRDRGGSVEVLLVHRPRYDDWSLPKGKREHGETDEQCAVREVEEETGVRARLGRELLPTSYRDRKKRMKSVRYWAMTIASERTFVPNREVDELRWVDAGDAGPLLSYPYDADVVASFVRLGRSLIEG